MEVELSLLVLQRMISQALFKFLNIHLKPIKHLKFKPTVYQLKDLESVSIIKFSSQLVKMVCSVSSILRIRIPRERKIRTPFKLSTLKKSLFLKQKETNSWLTLST